MLTFISCLAAFNYYTLIQFCLVWLFKPLGAYADGLGFLLTFVIVFLFLQFLAITFLEEHTEVNSFANALGGAVFGIMSGVLLGGLLSIAWLMMPGAAYYFPTDAKAATVVFDADEKLLTVVRYLSNDIIPGSESFDPFHTWMRDHTNKYNLAKGIDMAPRLPAARGVGLSSKPNAADRTSGAEE